MVLLIDNYDSFSYNLVQMAGSIRPDIKVIRNDAMTVEEIEKLNPSHIILSPGPGYPKDAGVCEEVVKKLAGKIPILGVCLGHQAICEVTDIPCAVGFGISTPEQAKEMAAFSDGTIVGSAIVRIVAEHGTDCVPYVKEYVKKMKVAVAEA